MSRPSFAALARLVPLAALVLSLFAASCGGSSNATNGSDASPADASSAEDAAPAADAGNGSDGSVSADGGGLEDAALTGDASDGGASDATPTPDAADATSDASETDAADAAPVFDVEPSTLQTLSVQAGASTPTASFTATLGGVPVSVTWQVDRALLGGINAAASSTGTFTPSGAAGGLVTIRATLDTQTLTRQVFVQLTCSQNGATVAEQSQVATTAAQLTAGSGVGGVGGEGLGPAVTDAATLAALATPTSSGSAQGLALLYPYDKTVWPLGLPAPLLQWAWSVGNADAIAISLATSSGSFSCATTYAPPAILATTGGSFIRHPIPQDVWTMATLSSAGKADPLSVSLTVASGGIGYGPISETWTIAPATLDAILYYTTYGGQLVQNFGGAVGGNGLFGAYVTSVPPGSTTTALVAGANGSSGVGCRACHSAASGGSMLVAQHGENFSIGSAYTLSPSGAVEHILADTASDYGGIYPDGSFFLSSTGVLYPLPVDTTPLPSSGLPAALGAPSFSPDGTKLAFTNNGQQLSVMSFAKATGAFTGSALVVDDSASATAIPAWPAFLPDSQSLVFHQQSAPSTDPGDTSGGDAPTRAGAKAQIDWTNTAGPSSVTPLDNLNGAGYLPKLSAPITMSCLADGVSVGALNDDHSDDVDTNYQPSVSPVPAAGYAWVVFTSRRMYGSVAQIPSYCSDPRGVDLVQNVSPKKIWIAAVDLDAAPGTDSSHPAFYFPGQDLLSSSGRPVLALPPCLANGASCATGDQCCDGYCNGTPLACASTSTGCANVAEKCATAADCCNATNACINGFCEASSPQ